MIPRIEPMLAIASEPFDSDDHLYEVKWDGVRCLAAVEAGQVRLWGRELADYTGRYPEMDALGKLPTGTVVDGELVVFRDGRADLDAVLRRHQMTGRFQTKLASRQDPAVYVAFDLLFHRGRSLISAPDPLPCFSPPPPQDTISKTETPDTRATPRGFGSTRLYRASLRDEVVEFYTFG